MIEKPTMIAIEPTNICNLNCPYCLVGLYDQIPDTSHKYLQRSKGYMNISLYKKIISDVSDFGITWIHLQFQGEPLLHPEFVEMVNIAKLSGINTHVYTNGLLITKDLAKQLANSGLDSMSFSIDGASPETYSKTKAGGNFERVIENLAIMKEASENSAMYLTWQFLVTRYNEMEVGKAKRMADLLGVHFYIKRLCVTDKRLVPTNKEYIRQLREKPCKDIYRRLLICWNGDVIPCIFDTEGKYVLGNIEEKTISEIWFSDKYVELRRKIDSSFSSPDDEPEFCKKCLRWGFEKFTTSDGSHSWM